MRFALHVTVMSSAFFNPSFAFSSHFDTGKGTMAPTMRIAVDLRMICLPTPPHTYLLMLDWDCTPLQSCQHHLILCISAAVVLFLEGTMHRLCTAQHVYSKQQCACCYEGVTCCQRCAGGSAAIGCNCLIGRCVFKW